MGLFRLGDGEVVRADLTAPLRALTFPVLELILITGISWILIGWLDRPDAFVDVQLRNAVVVGWFLLAVWRFGLPLLRSRRRRFIVTDRRIVVRDGALRSRVDSIPLRDVRAVSRRRRGISLAISGYARPLYFPDVPKTKKITGLIETSLPSRDGRWW